MSQRDLKKLHVLHKVLDGEISQRVAGEMLRLSDRQIRRMVKRLRDEGDAGILHRLLGCPSNKAYSTGQRNVVIELYQSKYAGFGPTLAAEKLREVDRIDISDESLRVWLIQACVWKKGRARRKHRLWRRRKEHSGDMVQMDGSHHDWFEGRGPRCVLMGYIDDATSSVYARFYEYEGTLPAMDSFKRYIKKYGLPMSVYLDRHTTYKPQAGNKSEDVIDSAEPVSQFGRALKELGVELIHAHSPQAKGRVERLFRTLQDWLVKEMRLFGVSSIEEANLFLDKYLPKCNEKLMVAPHSAIDMHRALTRGTRLDDILCIKSEHVLRNDSTFAHNGRVFQVYTQVKATKTKVQVMERVDGSMVVRHQNVRLEVKEIDDRPVKILPKKRIRKGYRTGTHREIIPIERLLWNDGAEQTIKAGSKDYLAA